MSPLELIVLVGIIVAFTAFAFILTWVSRADGNVSPARGSVPRRVAAQTHPTAPHDRVRPA